MISSFKPEEAQPTAIPGQILCSGTSVWHYNRVIMQFPPENGADAICKLNKNLSHISPTTSTPISQTNLDQNLSDNKQIPTRLNHMKTSLDYPLCSSLLNDHLFQADFYGGLGSYTINTEWLVWLCCSVFFFSWIWLELDKITAAFGNNL